jgi:beta-lactamase superfamily II metal-dependent hydrolase
MLTMDPPAGNEVEVTLLGRGVGECVVLHLLDDDWMIVDSFRNGKVPAAQHYLDSLGVDPAHVKTIVVTHFHTDHYRGIDLLHDYYTSARLMVTDALNAKNFVALYGDSAEPPVLGVLPGTIKRARDRTIGTYTPGLRHLKAGQEVFQSAHGRVIALSPTDAAVLQSNVELGNSMAVDNQVRVISKLKDDNRCSVVLYVDINGVRALLGADLVADAPAYGWQALLDEPNHQHLQPVDLVKVPHHGGVSGHDESMWDRLVTDDAIINVAPYWSSGLPRDTDIARLCLHGTVWQAAPSVSFELDEDGYQITRKAETGMVQARRRVDEGAWRVEPFVPAFLASPQTVE